MKLAIPVCVSLTLARFAIASTPAPGPTWFAVINQTTGEHSSLFVFENSDEAEGDYSARLDLKAKQMQLKLLKLSPDAAVNVYVTRRISVTGKTTIRLDRKAGEKCARTALLGTCSTLQATIPIAAHETTGLHILVLVQRPGRDSRDVMYHCHLPTDEAYRLLAGPSWSMDSFGAVFNEGAQRPSDTELKQLTTQLKPCLQQLLNSGGLRAISG